MDQSLSQQSSSTGNHFMIFLLTAGRGRQQSPNSADNLANYERRHGEPSNNGSDTPNRADTRNSTIIIDGDQTLWDKLVALRARREILTARLRLFVRISIIFVVLILVLGVDPLRLPWWLVFIPMILMILNLVYIATIKSRIRTIDREEVNLQQSMGRVEMGQDTEATYLPPPPPTYAAAAAQPPAYLNPLITPSYTSLLPTRARSNLSLREQMPHISQHPGDTNHVSIEMTQAASSSSGLVATPVGRPSKIDESS